MKMYEGEVFKVVTMQEFPKLKTIQISNLGRIKRGYYILNKKKRYNKEGYEVVYIKEVDKEILVHRMLADTFHPEQHTEERCVVDHLDGDKKHNTADNLEWVTIATNTQRYFNSLDAMEKKRRNAASNILAVNYDTRFSTVYPSIVAASKATGVATQVISQVIRGDRTRYGNYCFFKLSEIKGIVEEEQDGIESGLNRELGYWAQANFEGYSIRVSDTDMNRSTKQDLVQDVIQLKEIIEKKINEV